MQAPNRRDSGYLSEVTATARAAQSASAIAVLKASDALGAQRVAWLAVAWLRQCRSSSCISAVAGEDVATSAASGLAHHQSGLDRHRLWCNFEFFAVDRLARQNDTP